MWFHDLSFIVDPSPVILYLNSLKVESDNILDGSGKIVQQELTRLKLVKEHLPKVKTNLHWF